MWELTEGGGCFLSGLNPFKMCILGILAYKVILGENSRSLNGCKSPAQWLAYSTKCKVSPRKNMTVKKLIGKVSFILPGSTDM